MPAKRWPETRGLGLLALLILAILLPLFYSPCWQTWDDVALAMLINGYGLADSPSIHLFYCNFIWAWLIQHLPDFLGISNYTWALYACTLLAVVILWLALTATRGFAPLKLATVSCVLFYAFLNPQFTVTALLAGLAAACCFLVHQDKGGWPWLAAALFSACMAFIIRDWCLAFMAVLALPAVRWRRLAGQKTILAICCVTGFALIGLYALNQHFLRASQTPETLAWNGLRQKLSDAHAGKMLVRQPALLQKYGYSENDINLLATHFSLAKPLMRQEALAKMLAESDSSINRAVNLEKVEITFEYFLSWPLWLLLLTAIILLLSRFSLRSCLIFLLFGLIFLTIGYFNRGGVWIARIYYPAAFALICFLLLLPVNQNLAAHIRLSRPFEASLCSALLLLAILAFSKENLVEAWKMNKADMQEARHLLADSLWYSHTTQIDRIYSPFAPITALKKLGFQCASWPAPLKNSRSYFPVDDNDGFDKFLRSGFNMGVSREHLQYLAIYCAEHLNGVLSTRRLGTPITPDFYHLQCLPTSQ